MINSARLTLEPKIEPRDSNFVLRGATGYYFDLSSHVTWDVRDFWEFARQAGLKQREGDLQAAITAYESARALYHDDFLVEDPSAPWAVPQRQVLQAEYRDLLSGLAEAYAGVARYPDAIRAGEAALKVDPLVEGLYRQLMRYHYLAGNKAQALKVYRNCEKLFGELFGEGLTPQTKHLFELISGDAPLEGGLVGTPNAASKPG